MTVILALWRFAGHRSVEPGFWRAQAADLLVTAYTCADGFGERGQGTNIRPLFSYPGLFNIHA